MAVPPIQRSRWDGHLGESMTLEKHGQDGRATN